ncbi:hypothetical protein [Streptomyces sp. NPDC005805]|uniref:terpene synthase family protein n=1 Tax=Streptomyces sp. NPDC005805 TaxID=3157068 RepID=UPI0033EF8571
MNRIGAEFVIPWPLRVNPHVAQARDRAVRWMADSGLLRGDEAVRTFHNWRLAEVAAYFYPDADADDCTLAAKMMGWYFVPFDDQLDGEGGRDPRRVAAMVDVLIGVVHGTPPPADWRTPTVLAFADLWADMTRRASPALLTRLRGHWSAYFSSQATEALDRANGFRYGDLESYFTLRADTTCCYGQNDLGELWGGRELPPFLWSHPLLTEFRRLGADLVALRNDSLSTRHEETDGVHNAVFILERLHDCDRAEAVALASRTAQAKMDRLLELEAEALPRLMKHLDGARREAVACHVDVVRNWIVGDYVWEAESTRNAGHRETPDWARGLLFGEDR